MQPEKARRGEGYLLRCTLPRINSTPAGTIHFFVPPTTGYYRICKQPKPGESYVEGVREGGEPYSVPPRSDKKNSGLRYTSVDGQSPHRVFILAKTKAKKDVHQNQHLALGDELSRRPHAKTFNTKLDVSGRAAPQQSPRSQRTPKAGRETHTREYHRRKESIRAASVRLALVSSGTPASSEGFASSEPALRTAWSSEPTILLALLAAPPTTPFTSSLAPPATSPAPACRCGKKNSSRREPTHD